jgi:hypothetical protein
MRRQQGRGREARQSKARRGTLGTLEPRSNPNRDARVQFWTGERAGFGPHRAGEFVSLTGMDRSEGSGTLFQGTQYRGSGF